MATILVRDTRELGTAIRSARRAQGVSQAELAHDAQVGRQWLVALEAGDKASAPLDMVSRVLAELGLEVTLAPQRRVPRGGVGAAQPIILASEIIARHTKTPAPSRAASAPLGPPAAAPLSIGPTTGPDPEAAPDD
jgi:HTH-type transcriptional regulator/antitoxin HipB